MVVAPPGAGKSTRIPPALVDAGPVILLQPRRVAARNLARRIADEQGWRAGGEVGWQVRFERRFDSTTRLLVATEGILTARLREDPLLEAFTTVILDEFHERSLHADLAVAMALEAVEARDDLRLLVMSATLDATRVAAYLGRGEPCPVVEVPGRLHPIAVRHALELSVAGAARQLLDERAGDVLAFLPGMREIRAAQEDFGATPGVAVHVLHGSLAARDQDAALRPSPGRKLILATNVAETSLTVEGVTGVVDTGLHKVLRFDPGIELDRLETERVAADSAEQRAGRAGRLGPGVAVRLWDPRETLRAHRQPDIARVDLAAPVLDLMAWGADPARFPWFEPPPAAHLAHALEVLRLLGALEGDPPRLTAAGHRLARLPVHPRLGRLLQAAGGSRQAARLAALLSEGGRLAGLFELGRAASSSSDALVMLDRFDRAPESVRRAARDLERVAGDAATGEGPGGEEALRRAILAAFPDRVARRRQVGGERLLLAGGHGAVLARESTVRQAEYLVALDVAARRGEEALVRTASAVERGWLEATEVAVEHRLDEAGRVRAVEVRRYLALVLGEHPVPPDPGEAAALLTRELTRRRDELVPEELRARLAFAGLEPDYPEAFARLCFGRTSLPEVTEAGLLDHGARARLEREAPATLALPSGRRTRLEYRADGTVVAAAKLQELFGLAETPRLGPRRVPVLLSLLAPNGKSVQLTDDLASFWQRTYPEVRKELRGRYPRHPWPEDPWTATPTARAKPRRGR